MDIISALIAGLFGCVGGAIGVVLGKKIVKEENKNVKILRQVISVFAVVLVVGVWQIVLKPQFYDNPKVKSDIETAFLENGTFGTLFKSMKKYDEKNYNAFLDELSTVASSTGANNAIVSAAAAKLGASYTKKYFLSAGSNEVFQYLKSYYNFLLSLIEKNPLLICQLENPQVFGFPDSKVLQSTDFSDVINLTGKIVESSINQKNIYDAKKGEMLFNTTLQD